MSGAADRRSRLAPARTELLERPDVDLRGVAASWRRRVAFGVHPSTVISEYYPDLEFDSRLVRRARQVIEQLVEQIGEVPTCVALTDKQGRGTSRPGGYQWVSLVSPSVESAMVIRMRSTARSPP